MYILTNHKGRSLGPAYRQRADALAAARDFALIGSPVRVAYIRGR
jgi:hypothetical protein